MKRKKQPIKIKSSDFSPEELKKDILREAKVLNIHFGFATIIADKVTSSVESFINSHPVVTKTEIDSLIVSELEKYNKDLAYIYHNRDKII